MCPICKHLSFERIGWTTNRSTRKVQYYLSSISTSEHETHFYLTAAMMPVHTQRARGIPDTRLIFRPIRYRSFEPIGSIRKLPLQSLNPPHLAPLYTSNLKTTEEAKHQWNKRGIGASSVASSLVTAVCVSRVLWRARTSFSAGSFCRS